MPGADWPFGWHHDGKLINNDILRYQEAVSNIVRSGILKTLSKYRERKVFIEIGSGVGGLAIHLQKFLPNVTYIPCLSG